MPTRARMPKESRERWQKTYDETPYRELPWFSPTPYSWVRRIGTGGWWKPGERILDIGCGAGTNTLFLARSGFRATGVDLAPGAIRAATQRAKRAGLPAEFRVADALELPFPKGRFGGLTDVGCFHTLPFPLRPHYARELARVLKPRGRYALAWVAREFTGEMGPAHRPSVEEVASVFESQFQMLRVEFLPGRRDSIPAYGAVLERRSSRQPARR
ncbi:MAG: class I SAM-dependent methyltransferase [Thermoplasmata archaeon]|nr:class I SAM-dependent methyltransferase [Thermoplasmata archaeon]